MRIYHVELKVTFCVQVLPSNATTALFKLSAESQLHKHSLYNSELKCLTERYTIQLHLHPVATIHTSTLPMLNKRSLIVPWKKKVMCTLRGTKVPTVVHTHYHLTSTPWYEPAGLWVYCNFLMSSTGKTQKMTTQCECSSNKMKNRLPAFMIRKWQAFFKD